MALTLFLDGPYISTILFWIALDVVYNIPEAHFLFPFETKERIFIKIVSLF